MKELKECAERSQFVLCSGSQEAETEVLPKPRSILEPRVLFQGHLLQVTCSHRSEAPVLLLAVGQGHLQLRKADHSLHPRGPLRFPISLEGLSPF